MGTTEEFLEELRAYRRELRALFTPPTPTPAPAPERRTGTYAATPREISAAAETDWQTRERVTQAIAARITENEGSRDLSASTPAEMTRAIAQELRKLCPSPAPRSIDGRAQNARVLTGAHTGPVQKIGEPFVWFYDTSYRRD